MHNFFFFTFRFFSRIKVFFILLRKGKLSWKKSIFYRFFWEWLKKNQIWKWKLRKFWKVAKIFPQSTSLANKKAIFSPAMTEIDFFHLPQSVFLQFSPTVRNARDIAMHIIFSRIRPQCASNKRKSASHGRSRCGAKKATLDDLVFLFSEQMMSLTCTHRY